jgi:hypothetical protein
MNARRILGRTSVAVLAALMAVPIAWPGPVAAAGPVTRQQAYAKASNTGSGDNFGSSVAISGNTMVVGAPYEASAAKGINGSQTSNAASDAGAAYVFVRSGTTWKQQAYLKASNTNAGDSFGFSVAISGNTIIVGAPFEDSAATGINGNQADNSAQSAGAAYVFLRSGTTWKQQAYLKASNTKADIAFGTDVAISGNLAVVGAPAESSAATGVNGNQADTLAPFAGAAYVFGRSSTTWSQQAYVKASNTDAGDQFGTVVAISGSTVVVGAPGEASIATGVNPVGTDNSANSAGAAYVFTGSAGLWTQQAYLKASNTNTGDEFGSSIGVSGNEVVIGAIGESSAATGVNGNQSDNSLSNSGAVYAFSRTASVWTQQAYLKASNTGANDQFGSSLAFSGATAVVGAESEASRAVGVNGNQADNSMAFAGAAYVLVVSGGSWHQQAYLKASNTNANDSFGIAVAVSGDTFVAGATGEASVAKGINGSQKSNAAPDSGAAYVFLRSPVTTKTTLAGPSSVKAGLPLKLTGTVSPAAAPGSVTITRSRLVGGVWKVIGRTKVALVGGKFVYAVTLTTRGSWRFVAAYSGGAAGGVTYASSRSATKGVVVQ